MLNKSICFVGLDNYPVLNPAKGGEYFGGESVQQTLLAKAFRDKGYTVTMVVKDHGQPQGEIIHGIKVWKTFNENDGLPVFRFLYPRLTSIISALKKADADIYYQSCAGMLTGVVAWFCKTHKKKFIFRLASDTDCLPGEQIIDLWRDRKIYEYGIKRTTFIAAQSVKQVDLLQRYYNLQSTVINMAVELPESDTNRKRDIDILWVNNIRDCKCPFMVLQLAEMLPEYRFFIIGGAVPGSESLYREVKERSTLLDNVEFLGAIPYDEVNDFFSRAKLFLNTSDIEGFPNSFLQAWARSVAVVSFFDPDGLIATKRLGAVPNDIEDMAVRLRRLMSSDDERHKIAATARKYVFENYLPVNVAAHYEKFVL